MRRLVCILRGHLHDGVLHEGFGSAWYQCARCGVCLYRFRWDEATPLADLIIERETRRSESD